MKRGVRKQVQIQRTVTYGFTRADLIKRLRLPADAIFSVSLDGGVAVIEDGLLLEVTVKQSILARSRTKEAP